MSGAALTMKKVHLVKKRNVRFPVKNQRNTYMMIILILVVLFIIASIVPMLRAKQNSGNDVASSLEDRIIDLEKKLETVESLSERLGQIESQSTKVSSFESGFNRLEATVTLKTNVLLERLNKLEKQISEQKKRIQAVELKKTSGNTVIKNVPQNKHSVTYHTVSKGETFYSISRRYEVTLDSLRKLNNFSEKTVIYPGQKIVVKK